MLLETHLRKQEEATRKKIEDQELLDRLRVTNDEEARRKLAEKQEYLEAQNKFLELAGANPPKPTKAAKAPKPGKKEVAQAEAEKTPDNEWGTLLQ